MRIKALLRWVLHTSSSVMKSRHSASIMVKVIQARQHWNFHVRQPIGFGLTIFFCKLSHSCGRAQPTGVHHKKKKIKSLSVVSPLLAWSHAPYNFPSRNIKRFARTVKVYGELSNGAGRTTRNKFTWPSREFGTSVPGEERRTHPSRCAWDEVSRM